MLARHRATDGCTMGSGSDGGPDATFTTHVVWLGLKPNNAQGKPKASSPDLLGDAVQDALLDSEEGRKQWVAWQLGSCLGVPSLRSPDDLACGLLPSDPL